MRDLKDSSVNTKPMRVGELAALSRSVDEKFLVFVTEQTNGGDPHGCSVSCGTLAIKLLPCWSPDIFELSVLPLAKHTANRLTITTVRAVKVLCRKPGISQ